jgi:hypothetical protein
MSELGQKAKYSVRANVVRCCPDNRHTATTAPCPFGAKSRLMHRSKQHLYSITSSAATSRPGGTVSPSALAVFRLITSSNLLGA